MLYLESPIGVGFSYSDDERDYIVDDDQTAAQNLLAVEKFFELYPEYSNRKFFITGESYAGVYVPTLAEAILHAQKSNMYKGAPLHGIAVGNGCTGCNSPPNTLTLFVSEHLYIKKILLNHNRYKNWRVRGSKKPVWDNLPFRISFLV